MNNNVNEQLTRMKAMMSYGLQTEGKKSYSSVEYNKEGADGKMYGIVREGTKYYIKVAKDKKNLVKENFDYIGGFVNRKDNEYSSYANALKQLDLKMMSLKEAYAKGKNIIIESWNPDKQENLALESTDKMRKEIMRQRQIMGNAALIQESKNSNYSCEGGECCKGGCECSGEGGDPFQIDPEKELKTPSNNIGNASAPKKGKGVNEAAEVLGWHKTGGDAKQNIADTYMDKSHGTEVGSDAPFDKPLHSNGNEASHGVVEECGSMAYSDNQNCPTPGTGEIGDDAPFDGEKGRQLDEEISDLDDSSMLDDNNESYDSEYEVEGDEDTPFGEDEMDMDDDSEMPMDDAEDDTEYELETYNDLDDDSDIDDADFGTRLDSIEDTLNTILDKLNTIDSSDFDDDDLYDDEMDMEGDDSEMPMDDEMDMDDEMGDDTEMPMDDEMGDDDAQIYESRSYRKMRLAEENRLNDFGMHPVYRKEPMQLPQTGEDKNSHGRDWNDASVHNEQPYGEKIGSGAPFEVDPKDIENSIAECITRILKKRI